MGSEECLLPRGRRDVHRHVIGANHCRRNGRSRSSPNAFYWNSKRQRGWVTHRFAFPPKCPVGCPVVTEAPHWNPTSPVVTPESPPIRSTSTDPGTSPIPRWDHQPPERGEALGHRFYAGYPRRCGDEDRALYEAKFMLPLSFSEATAAEKYMAHLQHNMPGWRQ
jgi:hypothetical protein